MGVRIDWLRFLQKVLYNAATAAPLIDQESAIHDGVRKGNGVMAQNPVSSKSLKTWSGRRESDPQPTAWK
ncbi:MAG: hypothetical protein WBW33_08425, partial [Bryobacteraceae bacterium]